MIKHAQGEKINLTMWKCNFEQGITRNYKALQMKRREALKGDAEALKGNVKPLKGDNEALRCDWVC